MSTIKKIMVAAICATLCVVLPMAFHAIPNAGSIFLPMHIPVLLCGLLCGWPFGFACGLLGPVLSFLTTGMPPAAILPSMIAELAAYGAVSGFLSAIVRTKRPHTDLLVSLAGAMLIGRIFAGITKALIFSAGSYSMTAWITAHFVTALPGIAIQLIFLPGIILALERARLVPARYSGRAVRDVQ